MRPRYREAACAFGAFALTVALLAWIVCALSGCAGVVADEHAAGMPLDASGVTEYDRPAWLPACRHAYKVVDRHTGASWWLLEMDAGSGTDWVAMSADGSDG